MGFLFDSLVHLLASEPAARQSAAARMVGRVLGTEAIELGGVPAGAEFGVWHFRKVVARPFAVTITVGLAASDVGEPGRVGQGHELIGLTLADVKAPASAPVARALVAVASQDLALGAVAPLPEGTFGRSSHTWVLRTELGDHIRDHAEYERILGGRLDLIVPVTEREARWIEAHGADAYVRAMREQGVRPYADRAPGETRLA